MAAPNTSTDLTEEDAADLQFPKEVSTAIHENITQRIETQCTNCYNDLNDRFILCTKCDISICCECFASGVEFNEHKNDHNYSVLSYDFPLFDNSDWTAKEELTLLDGLIDLGNWSSIAKKLPNRSVKDVKNHYDNIYISRKGNKSFPNTFPNNPNYMEPIVPYRFRLDDSQDPPRFKSTSLSYHSVAGYNVARSDFELEYDMNAEDLIANLEYIDPNSPNYEVLTELQCLIIKSYNRRLEERQRRRQIIREHGLIVQRKVIAWLHRYDTTITPPVYDRLCSFMQFYTGQKFEYLLEGLHRAGELKMQIARLCEFHKRGITTLEEARLYLNLKQTKEESSKELKSFHSNSIFNFKVRSMSNISLISTTAKRRSTFTPLDIIGMPGYEKLLSKERDLCRNVRLVPLTYLELKATLISENNKLGYIKLLTARRLLKIDVNKTRRLYDFLAEEGYIQKPAK